MSESTGVDSASHRQNLNYSKKVLFARVVWAALKPFFHFSPRHLYGWRNFLLRLMGAKVAKTFRIYPSAHVFFPWNFEAEEGVTIGWKVEIYSLGKITLKKNALISQRAHLCAGSHDYMDPSLPLITPPITLEEGAWICADAFIGPNVTVGASAIVAARAVVTKDVESNMIVGGNPAKVIKARS